MEVLTRQNIYNNSVIFYLLDCINVKNFSLQTNNKCHFLLRFYLPFDETRDTYFHKYPEEIVTIKINFPDKINGCIILLISSHKYPEEIVYQ